MKVTAERNDLRILGENVRKVCCIPHEVVGGVKVASVNRVVNHRVSEEEYGFSGVFFRKRFEGVFQPLFCRSGIGRRNAVYFIIFAVAVRIYKDEIVVSDLAETAAVLEIRRVFREVAFKERFSEYAEHIAHKQYAAVELLVVTRCENEGHFRLVENLLVCVLHHSCLAHASGLCKVAGDRNGVKTVFIARLYGVVLELIERAQKFACGHCLSVLTVHVGKCAERKDDVVGVKLCVRLDDRCAALCCGHFGSTLCAGAFRRRVDGVLGTARAEDSRQHHNGKRQCEYFLHYGVPPVIFLFRYLFQGALTTH